MFSAELVQSSWNIGRTNWDSIRLESDIEGLDAKLQFVLVDSGGATRVF